KRKEPELAPPPPLPRLSLENQPNGQPEPGPEPVPVPGPGPEVVPGGDGSDGDRASAPTHEREHTAEEPVRKRHREDRIACTAQKVQLMKQRLIDSERSREQWLYWRPILLNVGAGAALAVGLLVCWMYS
ncbi:hypothetical protein CRUP_036821, partial [Coryphaenoides rupestris]